MISLAQCAKKLNDDNTYVYLMFKYGLNMLYLIWLTYFLK